MIDLLKTVFKYKEKESPDRLGLYPEAIHTNALPERRYLWSARLLVILACLSICFNLMLVSGIYLMLPLLDSGPALFYHDHTFSSFAPLEKQERPIAAIDLLTESFLRDYVLLRHVVTNDYNELKSRWGQGSRLFWMSTTHVYSAFLSGDLAQSINQFKTQGLVRLAEVEWVKPVSLGFWQVQFITMDYYPTRKTPVVNIWRAYVRAAMYPIPYENRSLREQNPFGFLVTNYALSYIGTPEEPESYLSTAREVRSEQYAY